MDLNEPLFVFANVTYDTGSPLKLPRGYNDTPLLTVTSECRQAFPDELVQAGAKPTGERRRLIWQGQMPTFRNIRWLGGEFTPRPRPYLKSSAQRVSS